MTEALACDDLVQALHLGPRRWKSNGAGAGRPRSRVSRRTAAQKPPPSGANPTPDASCFPPPEPLP